MQLIVNCDGGARGNPGPAACAFVVTDHSGQIVYQQGEYLGQATNNQAEYAAVWLAVNWLANNYPDVETEFFLDSQLVVNQLQGNFKIKNDVLKQKLAEINNFIFVSHLKIAGFNYVSREKNFAADNLVNQTLDHHLSV